MKLDFLHFVFGYEFFSAFSAISAVKNKKERISWVK